MARALKTLMIGGVLLASALSASGCAPLAVGGTVAGVAVAASEERGLGGFVSDAEVQTRINKLWFDHSVDMMRRLNMTVDQGRVLLFGKAKDAQQRLDAVRLTWQANGVKEVINEIQVDENNTTVVTDAKDTWIRTQIRTRITFDMSISSQNYTIDAIEGVIYIMGVAKSQAELDAVLQHARSVAGVQRVVNYVRIRTANPGAANPASAPTTGPDNGGSGSAPEALAPSTLPRAPAATRPEVSTTAPQRLN